MLLGKGGEAFPFWASALVPSTLGYLHNLIDVEAKDTLLGLGKGLGCQIMCFTADLKINRP